MGFMHEVTRILSAIEQGDPSAAEQLLPLVYDELRRLAAEKMALEKPGQTLQATALVHEAYIRLVDVEKAQHWNSRGHFFAAAAEAMRRILVEGARRKSRDKQAADLLRHDVDVVEPDGEVRDDLQLRARPSGACSRHGRQRARQLQAVVRPCPRTNAISGAPEPAPRLSRPAGPARRRGVPVV